MNLVILAQRIRQLRKDRGLTLDEVASQTGLTRSWLSKVENYKVTPSLPGLAGIAEALGISLSELVDGLDERPRMVVVKKEQRQRVELEHIDADVRYESLAHKRSSHRLHPYLVTIPKGVGKTRASPHEGEEFLYVIEGELVFEYDGVETALAAGDSLYFEASVAHRVKNAHDEPAKFISVFMEPRLACLSC